MPEKPETPETQEKEEHIDSAGSSLGMGINIISSIIVGMAMGYGLDKLFDTAPLLMIIFIFLGFAAGIRTVWKQMESQNSEEK
jgi:ATP synthase protein I